MSVAEKTKKVINFVLVAVTVTRVLGMLMNKQTRRAILADDGRGPIIR